MRKLYYLKSICLFYVGLFLSVSAFAQLDGANLNNPIYAGTLTWGFPFTNGQDNSPYNGFGNDIGQASDDIYYQFTVPYTTEVTISHCDSQFDTYMHLLDANGTVIQSNDDNGPLCAGLQSSMQLQLPAGTYYVVSEGYSSNSGYITTSISLTGAPPAGPQGANLSNPIETGILNPGITYSDTKNNSPSNGYYNDIGNQSDDIYYRFTLANDAEVQISHCSSAFDTYMYLLDVNGNVLYSNDDSGPLCATLQASLGVSLSAGTYYVVSEGYGWNYGDITTSISIPVVQTFEEEADYVLANLDMSPVTSGILYDKVFPLANLEAYQGTANDPSTNSDHFHQAYSEMYNSTFNKAGLVTPEAFDNYLSANYDKTNHTIGVLLYTYHYLDTNAVKNNLLSISNGQLYDVLNRPAVPYIETTSVIATPLFPAETIVETGDHSFTFDPSTILTNTSLGITSITINFDDGYGDQVLYDGSTSFKGQAQTKSIFKRVAHWFVKKTFVVRLIIYLSNGTVYQSKSNVEVTDPGPKTAITGCNGGDQITITGAAFDGTSYGKGIASGGGKASIFYSTANCGTGKITKPIIFLDGIDPTNKRDVQKIYDEYINNLVTINGQSVLLGDKLRADGYDIVIFDYNDGGDLIEKNGLAVVELTQELYRRYGSFLQQDFVIIGPSMGALVGQYALAYAETNNINTHTRLYISFDGPHQGANASVGLQQLIDYFVQKKLVSFVFKDLREFKDGLHRVPSARQMLVHHSMAESETPAPDNYRNIFLSNLAAVNKYPNLAKDPTKIRKVAIINGSNSLEQNARLQPGGEILFMKVKRAGLLGVINGRAGDRLNISVNASPSSGRTTTADIWLFKPIINLATWEAPRKRYYAQSAPDNNSYDTNVGSYFGDVINPKMEADISYYQSLSYLIGGNDTDYRHNINATFIPTASAIDLQVPYFTLGYNFSNEDLSCTGKTPFDRIYAPTSNQDHVQITDENAVWFDNEIKGTPQPFPYQFAITGPSTFSCSDTYTVDNLSQGSTISWSTTGNMAISGSTTANPVTVSKVSDGSGTLTATITPDCGTGIITISKPVTTSPLPAWTVPIEGDLLNPHIYKWIYVYPEWGYPNATSYSWDIWPSGTVRQLEPGGAAAEFFVTEPGYYELFVTAYTPCGNAVVSTSFYIGEEGYYRYSAWPNPANNEVKVEQIETDKLKKVNLNNSLHYTPFEIKLYNEKGQVLRSAQNENGRKSAIINTQDLSNGIYFLHIIENKKIIKKQIIISH